MVGKEKAERTAQFLLSASPGDHTEVVISGIESRLTRFAHSAIHQNMSEDDATVSIRVILDNKVGQAATNKLDDASLRGVLDAACEQARRSVANPYASALAKPSQYPRIPVMDERTADYTPSERAERVREIVDITTRRGAEAAGVVSTSIGELLVANSAGVDAYTPFSEARVSVIASTSCGYGYGGAVSRRIGDIDFSAVAETAAQKSSCFGEPLELSAGEYEVILEPAAVGNMLSFLSAMSFGARTFHEDRSLISDQLGKRVLGSNISIWDDATDSRSLTMPFDFEGVPKRRVEFIDKGVAIGVAYDMATAALYGTQSTGHGLPPEARQFTSDPLATNLEMQCGESTLDEMISSTERGVLVTRFHYTNIVHQLKGIITGMTRDGTYLVENGKNKSAVKNLRFTQSIPEALNNVLLIGKEPTLVLDDYFGCALVPPLKISGFHFTGATEH